MTRALYPPERGLPRDRGPFDPVREGARYHLARELALAIWARVSSDATDASGALDPALAQRRFHDLAARLSLRGGTLGPDVGKHTRSELEDEGRTSVDELAVRAPGRDTLVAAEARRSQIEPARSDDTAPRAAAPRAWPVTRLDAATGSRMSRLFGVDLTRVPIVPDSPAATGSIRAVARDGEIHVRTGAYRPGTAEGDHLLAHELAHVVQQRGAGERGATRQQIEREADLAASQIAHGIAPQIRLRATAGAAYAFDESEPHAGLDPAHAAVQEALRQRGEGAPLPDALRRAMEARFGVDLSRVRLHADRTAEHATLAVQARAFTVGDDIFLAAGAPALDSAAGAELLAHELTHVVQGRAGRIPSATGVAVSQPDDALEREAVAVSRGAPGHAVARERTQVAAPSLVLHRTPEEAAALISRYTSWGNLDEAALGRAALQLVIGGQLALGDDVLTALGSTDRDDVSYEILVAMTDAQLAQLAGQATSRRFLDRMFDELTSGSVAAEEQREADRILQASQRQTVPIDALDRATTSPGLKIFPFRLPGLTVFHDAPIEARREQHGVWCHSFVRVLGTDEFQPETRTLPSAYFLGGVVLPETEVIGVRLYDLGGRLHITTPLFLVQLANATNQQVLEKVLEAAGIGLTLGTGALAGLGIEATMMARAVLWVDRAAFVLGTLTSLLREHRSWLVATFGPRFMDAVDIVHSVCAIWGIARLALEARHILTALRDAYGSFRGLASARSAALSSSETQTVQSVTHSTDELLQQIEQIQGARSTPPGDTVQVPRETTPTTAADATPAPDAVGSPPRDAAAPGHDAHAPAREPAAAEPDAPQQEPQTRPREPAAPAAGEVPAGWERFDPQNNEAFRTRLREYRGTDDTSFSFGGGEGKVFWKQGAATALKRQFQSQLGRMARSVQRLIDVRTGVTAEPTIASRIEVVEVLERGADWIYRGFDINTVPLSEAGPSAEAARLAAIEALDALRAQNRLTAALRLLRTRLQASSENLHWSASRNKIFVIDME